ncbi:hypothetical protein COCNU_02G002700 [Cocos nucifera]|uniref:Ubiquitin carboxyl-terminal hydrolase 15 n=1 Tax=Cocos nucifera TaxID=13894 RepID=A0A8K0HYG2_COCNU|nr:hypothetical protein COCNU_02G002700 [Cocos nucifera]
MKACALNLWNFEHFAGAGREYVGGDMLRASEADITALLLVLVVLPLVTYIFLGIWNETSKKKARISMLAQLAAEEALRVEAMASADVIPAGPSLKTGFHECARCFAPATTRCSRCKSVRYCSGKCQIIHWRLGHKQECQEWQDTSSNVSGDFSLTEAFQQNSDLDGLKSSFLGSDFEESLHGDLRGNVSSDPCVMKIDASQDPAAGRKLSDKRSLNRSIKFFFKSDESAACAYDDTISCNTDAQTECSSSSFTEFSSKDAPLQHKLGTVNFTPDDETHRIQDTSSSSTIKNNLHQSHKLTDEIRNGLKTTSSPGISIPSCVERNRINGCGTGANTASEKVERYEGGLSSASAAVDLNFSAEKVSAKGSIVFKKPPYTLGDTTSLSQKSAEKTLREYPSQGIERHAYMENESRYPQTNVSRGCNEIFNMEEAKVAGSKKHSKGLKQNLASLINDSKKNKVCQLLFPYEDLVKFFQCKIWGISPRGLLNCGNSCYANAVLQCLTCTKPLMVYLHQRLHSRACTTQTLALILLKLLVMSMQSTCLEEFGGEKEVDPRLQETTLVQQIFGGRLKSKVKCLRCHIVSERYENIMDLTLEIHGWVESLEDALTQFTAPEDLDGENMYRCGRCSAYVNARKQLTIHEVPNILTIVLKRPVCDALPSLDLYLSGEKVEAYHGIQHLMSCKYYGIMGPITYFTKTSRHISYICIAPAKTGKRYSKPSIGINMLLKIHDDFGEIKALVKKAIEANQWIWKFLKNMVEQQMQFGEGWRNIGRIVKEAIDIVIEREIDSTIFRASLRYDINICGGKMDAMKSRWWSNLWQALGTIPCDCYKDEETGNYGKINKCVTFPDMLDMIPFVTGTADNPPLYMLYAVVVHLDTLNASYSGHYVSYVKDLQGTWFRIDDSEVQAVPLSQVMSEGAYMLFYSRSYPRPPRAYIEKVPLQAYAKQNLSKNQKSPNNGQQKQSKSPLTSENSGNMQSDFRPEYREGVIKDQTTDYMIQSSSRNILPTRGTYEYSLNMDFSDATSSDWSLFTSSDESSFTTESTRDSFSTVDYGDNANLDPISSIFSPFCVPEYSYSNDISCTKFSPCRPQTRFFSEGVGCVMDSSMPSQSLGDVHKERNLEQLLSFSSESLSSASSHSLYGRYRSNTKDGFVRTSGFCDP